ncbi:MAG: Clp protease ClpP [Janthinobacterium lividum]
MQQAEAHVYFGNVIGPAYIDESDWTFYSGTRLDDVRFAIGDYRAFGFADTFTPPPVIVLHFTKCYGGDVYDGYEIYNYLRDLSRQGCRIEARVEGLCASIAVLIALAADVVNMSDVAAWFVHKPMAGDSSGLNADELRTQANFLDQIQGQIAGAYAARTGMSLDKANELINQTSSLTADQCIALGFVTGKLDQALKLPEGTNKVLNFTKPHAKPATPMAITPAEETRLVDKFIAAAKNFFAPKNEADATVPPAATNATAYKVDVTGGDPMYCDGELAQGSAVYSDEALTTAYTDGDYALADGRDVSVVAGVVESLSDGEADDSAELVATNAALVAQVAELQAANTLANRKVTGLTNKLAKTVPGSAGNPTPPGSAQNIGGNRGAAGAGSERSAERTLMLPKK